MMPLSRYPWCKNRARDVLIYISMIPTIDHNPLHFHDYTTGSWCPNVMYIDIPDATTGHKLTAGSWCANLDILGATTWSWCHKPIYPWCYGGSWCPTRYSWFHDVLIYISMKTHKDYPWLIKRFVIPPPDISCIKTLEDHRTIFCVRQFRQFIAVYWC
jgi:hypothetical protein